MNPAVPLILTTNFLRNLGLIFKSALAIEGVIKLYELCTNINENTRHHILDKEEHKFNDKCGMPCVISVAKEIIKNLKVEDSETKETKTEGEGFCKHGCHLKVTFGISTKTKEWKIATAWHVGPCKAI